MATQPESSQPLALTVSDHALFRYLERILRLDLTAIRGQMLDNIRNGTEIKATHVGTFLIQGEDGLTYTTNRAGNVLTVFDERKPSPDHPDRRKPKAGRHNKVRTEPHRVFGTGRSTRRSAVHRYGKMLQERDDG